MSTKRPRRDAAAPRAASPPHAWFVYVIRARGRVLYAGVTTDVRQRLRTHAAGRGAKYLRGRGPLRLVYSRELGARGLALRVEYRLKRMSKSDKETLVRAQPSRGRLLALLDLPRTSATRARHVASPAAACEPVGQR